MRTVILAIVLMAASAAPAWASYFVYCDRGRIQVDSRDNTQMRIARGSSFCQMGPQFSTRSGAQDFAQRNFGSIGANCSCR
jgi:hypothetical protein